MDVHFPSPAPDACFLFLVRHAATDNNLAQPPKVQGPHSDPGLSDEGRRQAEATGQFLADVPIAAVYSSPLVRARQTAEAIARPHGLTVETVPSLAECDVGAWEGRTWEDIRRSEPEAHHAFVTDPATNPYRGGENLTQLLARVAPALKQKMRQHTGQHIVVVAHNVVNRAYLASVLEVPLAKARGIDQANGGINVLRARGDEVKALSINVAVHLPS